MTDSNNAALERLPAFQALKRQIAAHLRDLAALAGESGDLIRRTADDLDALIFNVAVIGEFNRGKSTLINAILDRADLLATAPLPNTAAITRINALESGESVEHYRVSFRDPTRSPITGTNLAEIEAYVSEHVKPGESSLAERVESVELWIDSDFLRRNGIVLIDTPGLGAVTRAHQDVTERVIPTIHAALFVFMVDPPLGGTEIAFLTFSLAYVGRFLFVMNDKQNMINGSPEQAAEVIAYAERTLESMGIAAPAVIGVNPRAYLRGSGGGFDQFLPRLSDFLIEGRGRGLLADSLRKGESHLRELRTRAEHRLGDLDRQTDDLRAESANLRARAATWETRKAALIAGVDAEIREIVGAVAGDVDKLGVRIETATFEAIDSYGIGGLREAHIRLPEVIKNTVDAWMTDKSSFVNGRFNRLYRNTIADLRELLAEYHPAADPEASVQSALSLKLGMTDIRLNGDVAMAVAAGLAIAAGIVLAELITSGAIGGVLTLMAGAAGSGTAGAVLVGRVRTSLKAELKKPLPPPNQSRTMLSAVLEGYVDAQGESIPGVRSLVNTEFEAIGAALKGQIETIVHEAWQPRLTEIEAELTQRAATDRDLSTARATLNAELAALNQIGDSFAADGESLGAL